MHADAALCSPHGARLSSSAAQGLGLRLGGCLALAVDGEGDAALRPLGAEAGAICCQGAVSYGVRRGSRMGRIVRGLVLQPGTAGYPAGKQAHLGVFVQGGCLSLMVQVTEGRCIHTCNALEVLA